jgi:hypothetical protein
MRAPAVAGARNGKALRAHLANPDDGSAVHADYTAIALKWTTRRHPNTTTRAPATSIPAFKRRFALQWQAILTSCNVVGTTLFFKNSSKH